MTHMIPIKKRDILYKDKKWLNEQYWKNKRSARNIGKECGVSVVTILYWMKKFNIKRRKNPRAKKLSRLRCYCDILLETGWYYCPKCGRKIQHNRLKEYRKTKVWESDQAFG